MQNQSGLTSKDSNFRESRSGERNPSLILDRDPEGRGSTGELGGRSGGICLSGHCGCQWGPWTSWTSTVFVYGAALPSPLHPPCPARL